MTDIPAFKFVIDLVNFLGLIAWIGIFLSAGILVIGIRGFFAAPYSRWGVFVDRYITGYSSVLGQNLMWKCLLVLIACAVLRAVLPSFDTPTLPRFP